MTNQLKALEILRLIEQGNSIPKLNEKYISEAIAELESLESQDKLAELEKVILDYYLAKGYQVGVGGWAFNVEIESNYKSKQLLIYFMENRHEHYLPVFGIDTETTKELFDKAIEFFKGVK